MLFDEKKEERVTNPFEPQFADDADVQTVGAAQEPQEPVVSNDPAQVVRFTQEVQTASPVVEPSENAPIPEVTPFTKDSYKRPDMDGPNGRVTDPQTGKVMSRLAYDTKVVFAWLGANAAALPQEVLRAAQEIRPRAFGLGVDLTDPLARHERVSSRPRVRVGSANETKAQISLLRVLGLTTWEALKTSALPVSFTLDEAFERAKMGKKEVEKMLGDVVKRPMAHGEVVSRWDKTAAAYVIDSVEPDPEASVVANRRAAAAARVAKARVALEALKAKAKK